MSNNTRGDAEQIVFQHTVPNTLSSLNVENRLRQHLFGSDFGMSTTATGSANSTALGYATASGKGWQLGPGTYTLSTGSITSEGNHFLGQMTLPNWTTATRPAVGLGKFGFNTTTNTLEFCDNTGTWQSVGGGGGVLIGECKLVAMNVLSNLPYGYLFPDGRTVSRTTYSALWAALGYPNTGDGTTTFNLPNLVGRFWRAFDPSSGPSVGTVREATVVAHGHSGSTNAAGDHAHSGQRTSARISINNVTLYGVGGGEGASGTYTTGAAGAHSHVVTVSNTGEAEGHPRDVTLFPILRYI